MVLLSAGIHGVPCFSYTPQAVKQAVCGSGSAAKEQVQRMVGALLSLPEPPDARPRGGRPRRGHLPRQRRGPDGGPRVRRWRRLRRRLPLRRRRRAFA